MDVNIHYFRLINDLGKQFPMWNPVFLALAEYVVYGLALAVLLYWFQRTTENRVMVICGTVTFLLAELFGRAAGFLHANSQPFAELTDVNQLLQKAVNNSFPSDHTILFFSFCMSFWLFKKRAGIAWMLLAFCVGISRIWVGVHYPADVIAGALISIGSALTVYLVVPRLQIVYSLLGFYEKAEQSIFPSKTKSRGL